MNIEFLGTGTSQGVPVVLCDCEVCQSSDTKDKRLRSSMRIRKNDYEILIDVSPDFRAQMLRTDMDKIDAVLLTHEHNDHIAGMDDLRPYNFHQNSAIPIYGFQRVLDAVQSKFHYAFMENPYPGAPKYDLHPVEPIQRLKLGGINIQVMEVMHGDLPIAGFRFDDFVYITDAKYLNEETIKIAKDAEILVLNALRHEPHWSHLNLNEAMKLVDLLNPKAVYLTHVSHLMGKHEKINRELLDPKVQFAYDGLKLDL